MKRKISGLGAVFAVILLAGIAAASETGVPTYALRGGVIGNGGNVSGNGTHVLYGTAGQAVVGISDNAANILCHGFWCFGGVRVVEVEEPPGLVLPDRLAFGPPAPNPARGAVTFELALPEAAGIDLAIFDVQGREVGRMRGGRLDAGYHQLRWDARAEAPGAGVYFARLRVDGRLIGQRRIVLVQ